MIQCTLASLAKSRPAKQPVSLAVDLLHSRDFLARLYCSLAYSALACFRMGMSGSASFQRAKKRSLRQAHALEQVEVARVGAHPVPERVNRKKDHLGRMLVVSLFEQTERLVFLPESRVNRSKRIRIDI